jgi:hypothetical protein
MSRLYSNYQPPKLTKLAKGYDTLDPVGSPEYVKQQQEYKAKGPVPTTPMSEYVRRAVRPLVKNPVVQEVIDPKYDIAMAGAQGVTTAGAMVPGTQPVTVPLAGATNAFAAIRGGTQMLNNWVDGVYDTTKNQGGNTQLATDVTTNAIGLIPGSKLIKNAPDVLKPAYNTAVEMFKRPAALTTSTIGSGIATDQNKTNTQAQPTAAPVQSTNTQAQTQSPTQTVKTNSYVPRYIPPKNYYKLAEQERYQIQADYDPAFNIMQPGDNYRDFIRNNVKAQLEMGRRRGAFAGTILGAIGGGIAGHKLLEDNDTLGKYSPYAAGAAGALLGAGIGNLAGRPVGMLSSVSDIPYTVVQSMPIMQDAYRKLTQPVFPDYVDPNTYI